METLANKKNALRKQAEDRLVVALQKKEIQFPDEALLHELQVHQIELEMQNEELRRTQLTLEQAIEHYEEFYNFTPVGYLSLNHLGVIDEVNLTCSKMLGANRNNLVQKRFTHFVEVKDQERWHVCFNALLKNDDAQSIELALKCSGRPDIYARLDCQRRNKTDLHSLVRVVITDITERRQAEIAMQDSKALLKETQVIAGLGSYVLHIKNGLLDSSEVFNQLCGINECCNTVKCLIELIHPDDRSMIVDHFSNLYHGTGNSFDKEYRIIRHNDQVVRWIHGLGKLEFNEQGFPLKLIGTIQDITQRKELETALLESQSDRCVLEKQDIVQTSLDGYFAINVNDGRIVNVNDAFCDMMGYSRDELLSMSIHDLEAIESPAETDTHIQKIMNHGFDRFETVHRHKMGYLINLELSVSHSKSNGSINFAFVRDITERYRAEELLRTSYEEIEDLYNNAACGYHSLDKNGVVTRINDTELSWLGYARDEVIGKMKYADFLLPEDANKFMQGYLEFQIRGKTSNIERNLIRRDGSVLVALINSSAMYDHHGSYVMNRSTVVDITDRKRAEQDANQLSKHLAEVREEEKASIARDIHDELGSTLTALRMDTKWLEGKLPISENTAPLISCVKSMANLCETAITATRRIISALRPTILDDFGLLAAIQWQAIQFQKRTGILCKVECQCESSLEKNLGKSLSINLYRIFQESLTNVVKHSGASEVLTVIQQTNNEITFTIKDNGHGIPEGYCIPSNSFGLRGMRERVAQFGGSINFGSSTGTGFSLTVMFKL